MKYVRWKDKDDIEILHVKDGETNVLYGQPNAPGESVDSLDNDAAYDKNNRAEFCLSTYDAVIFMTGELIAKNHIFIGLYYVLPGCDARIITVLKPGSNRMENIAQHLDDIMAIQKQHLEDIQQSLYSDYPNFVKDYIRQTYDIFYPCDKAWCMISHEGLNTPTSAPKLHEYFATNKLGYKESTNYVGYIRVRHHLPTKILPDENMVYEFNKNDET